MMFIRKISHWWNYFSSLQNCITLGKTRKCLIENFFTKYTFYCKIFHHMLNTIND
ncbi:rCG54854, isoform CRA_a, partial [Rattus norvegicus]